MWPRAVLTVALRGPGKVLLLASAAGWIAMALLLAGDRAAGRRRGDGTWRACRCSTATWTSHSSGYFTAMWLAMILAMAPPLLLREIGRLWRTSLRRLRHLTLACFLCGYVGIWLLAGVALAMLSGWVSVRSERIAVAIRAGRALALLTGASALPQCLPPRANAARVRNGRPMGFAAIWGLNRLVLRRRLRSRHAPGPARTGPSPRRHGRRSRRGDVRAPFAREAPCLAASHLARPSTGVAPDACRDRSASVGWR